MGVLFITGLTLFLYYIPDQERAYARILHISTTLHYGGFIRNLHYVSANALIVLVFLHLIRVFCTGGYKGRLLNWVYGLGLLFLVLGANFTGYLLPWNQVSYWAIKVGSSLAGYVPGLGPQFRGFLLGGDDIGNETLLRMFALHAGIIPPALLLLTSLHLWRIRKDGGLAAPPGSDEDRLPVSPWAYRAEGAVVLLVVAMLVLLALFIDAPLHERPDPGHPPNPAKAPWYFVGFQEMVSYSAAFGGIYVPLFITAFFLGAPLLDRSSSPGGVWLARDRLAIVAFGLLILASQLVFIVIGLCFRGPNWSLIWPF
jgi:quinol-cytochrome oxidoreductase complex cytochrome b subunit